MSFAREKNCKFNMGPMGRTISLTIALLVTALSGGCKGEKTTADILADTSPMPDPPPCCGCPAETKAAQRALARIIARPDLCAVLGKDNKTAHERAWTLCRREGDGETSTCILGAMSECQDLDPCVAIGEADKVFDKETTRCR